jgi:hypothetical protein
MGADDPLKRRYQTAADTEADATEYKREGVLKQYAVWCPYMQQFCEALSLFEKDIDDRSVDDYLKCCRETRETISDALHAKFLGDSHATHLKESAEFLEGMIRYLQFHQERARSTMKGAKGKKREKRLYAIVCDNNQKTTFRKNMTDAWLSLLIH